MFGYSSIRLNRGREYPNGMENSRRTRDDFPCRPDFAALVYPAYLVGRKGKPAPELNFDGKMPPVFLLQTEDDPIRVENALYFFLVLKQKRIPAEMHLFAEGRHGYGMRKRGLPVDSWPDLLVRWLGRQ